MTKLKCYELKEILEKNYLLDGYEIFKSGKDVKIHFNEQFIKDKRYGLELLEKLCLDCIHSHNLSIIPETIPTNGYYTVEW